jgi:hypothetical protein
MGNIITPFHKYVFHTQCNTDEFLYVTCLDTICINQRNTVHYKCNTCVTCKNKVFYNCEYEQIFTDKLCVNCHNKIHKGIKNINLFKCQKVYPEVI